MQKLVDGSAAEAPYADERGAGGRRWRTRGRDGSRIERISGPVGELGVDGGAPGRADAGGSVWER